MVCGPELTAQETVTLSSVLQEEGDSCPGPSRVREDHGVISFTAQCSLICSDMIEHFKDTRVRNYSLLFTTINERDENGVGVGVEREVDSLFWKQFANSMMIGERQRVPFIRQDQFIEKWESVCRILVKKIPVSPIFPFVPIKSIHLLLLV